MNFVRYRGQLLRGQEKADFKMLRASPPAEKFKKCQRQLHRKQISRSLLGKYSTIGKEVDTVNEKFLFYFV